MFFDIHVFVCTNERPTSDQRGSCAGRGSVLLRDYMKAKVKVLKIDKIRINSAGCLDRCEEGPVMVIYPQGVWYNFNTYADIDEIIDSHLIQKAIGAKIINLTDDNDTIYALASGQGCVGVAVYRISGKHAYSVLLKLTGKINFKPREARFVKLIFNKDLIDMGLALWFPAPCSFTGEDVVEFHLHGGRAVYQSLIKILSDLGLRAAEAGEFTKRAVLNGKIDLTRAEAINDLINAETLKQKSLALRQMQGQLESQIEYRRSELITIIAHLEALIDFSDEDIPDNLFKDVQRHILAFIDDIRSLLNQKNRGEIVRNGIHIALIGAPNVGKSSFLNKIARRDVAIVSDIAGTTRDILEINLDLGGWPIILYDTAGIRESDHSIEQQGIKRALLIADQSDFNLVLFDASIFDWEQGFDYSLINEKSIIIFNKMDLIAKSSIKHKFVQPVFYISTKTGYGLDDLLAFLENTINEMMESVIFNDVVLTRHRHVTALEQVLEYLENCNFSGDIELIAENIRFAARSMGKITGRVDIEEVLDTVFKDFCIGK